MTDSITRQNTDLVQKILSGARWVTIFRTSAQILSWISTLIVVRFLAPEDYGLNSMLESPLVVITIFSSLGLNVALVQRKQVSKEELRSAFGLLLLLNTLLFILFFLSGTLLANYFNEPRLVLLSKVVAITFLIIPFRVLPNALLDRDLRFKLKAKVELIASILTTAITLTLAYLGAGVWALIAGALASRTLQALLLMVINPWFLWPQFRLAPIRKMITFGSAFTISSLFAMISDMLITLLAGPHLGAEQLGIYGVAATFATLPLSKGMPIINQTMIPAFAKFQENRGTATYYHGKLLGVVTFVFIPVIIGTACVARDFILTIAGEKWEASILPLQIMSLGVIFRMCTILYTPVINSMGRVDLYLKISALQLAFLGPLTFITMRYGVVELMFAWTFTEFIVMLATLELSKRVMNISFTSFMVTLKPAILAASIMSVSIIAIYPLLINQKEPVKLLIEVLIGAVTYLLTIRILYREQLITAKHAVIGR